MTYPNAARLLEAIPSFALIWWRLLHKTDELVFAELKVTLPGHRLILRSRRPDLVEQELYGLLLAHLTLRHLMYQASVQAACDPDTLSFAHVVRVVRRHLPFHAAFSSRQRQRMWQIVLVEIIAVRVKRKPGRTCPREVKRKIRVFPTKPPATTRRVRSNPTLQIRLCPPIITPDPDATAHVKRARKMARERFWWEHVRAWQTSGRTRTEYCCQKNLSANSFDLWVNRLRHRLRKPQKRA